MDMNAHFTSEENRAARQPGARSEGGR
jgi:hypothetical protein